MSDDEWTFVPQRKGSKHRCHQHRPGRRNSGTADIYKTSKQMGGRGLYRESTNEYYNHEKVVDGHQTVLYDEQQKLAERERIKHDIIECVYALENSLHASNNGFVHRLISSISTFTSSFDDVKLQHDAANNMIEGESDGTISHVLPLRDIVAYGIGNFATGSFQAPMLQLACLLLIRRCAAASAAAAFTTNQSINKEDNKQTANDYDDVTSRLFEEDQIQAPIYYYEPCILPVEKELLENVFHVHVIDSNEMGKRTVESMRQEYEAVRVLTPATEASSSSSRLELNQTHTLFYMPHCPMQLYCNVLWAHWCDIFPKSTFEVETASSTDTTISTTFKEINPILIFGNSFCTYDNRTISSKKRKDPTNGIFRILPYINEVSTKSRSTVIGKNRNQSDEIIVDALRNLDVAFNDCNVISFTSDASSDRIDRPDRPKEWVASDNPNNNGELM